MAALPAKALSPATGQPVPATITGLRSVTYYEDYLSNFLRIFRQYAGENATVSRAQIELVEKRRAAGQRAQFIQSVLQADLDGDGNVTRAEASDYFEQIRSRRALPFTPGFENQPVDQWFRYDTNNDTILSFDEIRLAKSQDGTSPLERQAELLFTFDKNKDGILAIDEIRTGSRAIFDQYDSNKDGILSETEKGALFPVLQQTPSSSPYLPPSPQPSASTALPLSITKGAELHAIGVYEGNPVNIRVERGWKKTALLLTSYEPTRWNITTSRLTKISEVYVASHGRPSEVFVNGKPFDAMRAPIGYTYQASGIEFRRLLDTVKNSMKRDRLDSFHGNYRAPAEGFAITEVSNDPELQQDRLAPVASGAFPKLEFTAQLNNLPGVYQLSGNLAKSLPANLLRATYVAPENAYYGFEQNGLTKFDANGKLLENIPLSLDVQPLSWPTDITYNPSTNSVVIASFGGEGFLYRFQLQQKRWSASSLNNNDYTSFRYDPATGHYIGARTNGSSDIDEVGEDGKFIRKIALDVKTLPGAADTFSPGNSSFKFTVLPYKEHLVVMVGGGHTPGAAIQPARIYLYDRKTQKTVLTYTQEAALKQKPGMPEPS